MSESQKEYHPWVNSQTPKFGQSRIILGSFPVWSLTRHESDAVEEKHFRSPRLRETNEFPFFYGSSVSRLWAWYQTYLDSQIRLLDLDSIVKSLDINKIGITDAILSCVRKNRSALDNDLSKRIYNHDFFVYPQQGRTIKILCTSKGVMNEMLMHKTFFKQHPDLTPDPAGGKSFQADFIKGLGGDQGLLVKPVFARISVKNGGAIECLSLPSPGSPYRRLIDFGLQANSDADKYLQNYLQKAFEWFNHPDSMV